jgi:hypothetical protein
VGDAQTAKASWIMKTTLSPLVLGLSKLLEKGDWTFWFGDGSSYDFTPKNNMDYRVVLSRHDDSVYVRIGNRYDSVDRPTKKEQAHLREVCTRVYLEPFCRAEAERKKVEEAAEKARLAELRTNLERLGAS